jgi:hypothetical protein
MRRLAFLLALLICAGCAPRYSVLAEGPTDAGAVRGLSPIFATSLQVAFQQPGWEPPEQWLDHVAAWNQAYLAGLAKAGRDLGGRGVQHLPPGAAAPQGLVVTTTLRDIQRGASLMAGDKIVVDVVFVEAATRRPVLTATLEVGSFRASGPEGYTFGGRIKFALLNLADAVAVALRKGQFPR